MILKVEEGSFGSILNGRVMRWCFYFRKIFLLFVCLGVGNVWFFLLGDVSGSITFWIGDRMVMIDLEEYY